VPLNSAQKGIKRRAEPVEPSRRVFSLGLLSLTHINIDDTGNSKGLKR